MEVSREQTFSSLGLVIETLVEDKALADR